jgi:hypothetical protein
VYLLGSVSLAFGPWIFAVWSFDLYPKNPSIDWWSWAIKSFLVWLIVPLSIFAGLLEMYVRRIKKGSRRLQKYGFLGKGIYN